MHKVKDAPGFLKDPATKSVVSVDNEGLEAYRDKRKKANELNSALANINTMQKDIEELKELKVMLAELLLHVKGIT